MVTLRSRSETVGHTETVQLHAQFKQNGILADLDSFPSVSIIQPSGNVLLAPTSAGVYRLSTGIYGFDYAVGINAPIGIWTDSWTGTLDGYNVAGDFVFVVLDTNLPGINSDGYVHLGDDPGFDYDQVAILNINKLLRVLKARLNSSGKKPSVDSFGNQIFTDCDIFSIDSLVLFLEDSLSLFNEIPHTTNFTFDDTPIMELYRNILVQGATLMALSSIALIERGREFQITDNGVNFAPPGMSELLNTQWNAELTNHLDKVRQIKASMKPGPMGLGTMTISAGRNPAVSRLRHLRARQIF